MEKIAIDLLWLRPGKVGGTESYIRNLLDGLARLEDQFQLVLLVSRDNAETFEHYTSDQRYSLLVANVKSEGIAKRIIWQNIHQNRLLRKNKIRKCFEPVYCKPWLNGGIEYTCVIHDLQAYHYPEYHPFHEVAYSRLCWRMDTLNAARIYAISEWVRDDIREKYHRQDIEVIYNPILLKKEEVAEFSLLASKYGIEERNFFYTVSQLIPHKNLITLIKVMKKIVQSKLNLPQKLVVSGVNGQSTTELKELIRESNLEESIVLTGYISNAERNTLYRYCHTFLFSSVFEGFGMPPVEAMLSEARVVTTCCASIPEVTQNQAIYVNDPYDVDEWIDKIEHGTCSGTIDFSVYDAEKIAKQYLTMLKEPVWKKR